LVARDFPLRAISFKNTALFKRGIWLTAAALLAFVAAPSALDGSLWRNPLPSAIAVGLLCAVLMGFFWNTQIHRLADEVFDRGDSLTVRKGRIQETIPFSNVSAVKVSSSGGFHRITVALHAPCRWGRRIEFLPQASLWSNLPAIKNVAEALNGRASRQSE
jgi:hypothetical protein